MLTIQRRNEIKMILFEKGSVTISELAERFHVSYQTIRRDFEALEAEGFLAKAYGGAVLKKHVKPDIDIQVREELFLASKQRIAKKAAELIYPDDSIFLDYSTTVFHLLEEIKGLRLTIMTNSLKVMNTLAEHRNKKLFSIGGEFDPSDYYFSGYLAEKYISNFHLDKAFLSCRAIMLEKGVYDRNEREAESHRLMIEHANSVYLLMDHTKFDKEAFVYTCDYEKITGIITDFQLSESWKDFLEQKGINYYECC